VNTLHKEDDDDDDDDDLNCECSKEPSGSIKRRKFLNT
jgi:hypothetical protein